MIESLHLSSPNMSDTEKMTTNYCGVHEAYEWLWLAILRRRLNISSAGYGLQTDSTTAYGSGSGLCECVED